MYGILSLSPSLIGVKDIMHSIFIWLLASPESNLSRPPSNTYTQQEIISVCYRFYYTLPKHKAASIFLDLFSMSSQTKIFFILSLLIFFYCNITNITPETLKH